MVRCTLGPICKESWTCSTSSMCAAEGDAAADVSAGMQWRLDSDYDRATALYLTLSRGYLQAP